MSELIVKDSIDIAATAANVWRVLTEPEQTRKYMFGCEARSDWRPGSPLEWVVTVDGKPVTPVKGAVVAIERERLLSYTVFGTDMGLPDVPENYLTVTCRLVPAGAYTRLEITQGDYTRVADGEKRHRDTIEGWHEVLVKMKALAEAL